MFIVVGAGHAGCEAALATGRMGLSTLLVTMSREHIARDAMQSCHRRLAKGQLVREVDALGGEMGLAIDETGIQFRMLNRAKGPAVWSPRRRRISRHITAGCLRRSKAPIMSFSSRPK